MTVIAITTTVAGMAKGKAKATVTEKEKAAAAAAASSSARTGMGGAIGESRASSRLAEAVGGPGRGGDRALRRRKVGRAKGSPGGLGTRLDDEPRAQCRPAAGPAPRYRCHR